MGDPACWLHATCFSCGRVLEANDAADAERSDQGRCPHFGAEATPSRQHPAPPDAR